MGIDFICLEFSGCLNRQGDKAGWAVGGMFVTRLLFTKIGSLKTGKQRFQAALNRATPRSLTK